MSYISFCNFNSKLDGRRYDCFFHLITALPFPLQNLVQGLRSQTPSSVSSTPSEVSAIPCVLFGNTLRALFLKNRHFFCYGVIFLPNTRGPLGCLLRFWPSGKLVFLLHAFKIKLSNATVAKSLRKCLLFLNVLG